jgi:hypothetical protein
VRDVLVARYDVARGGQDSTAAPADPAVAAITTASANTGANASATAAAPDTAGIASAFAAAIPARKADDMQVFHGLFADDHRTVPLASMMGTLWATSNTPVSGDGASDPNPNANRMLNLFRDLPAASS